MSDFSLNLIEDQEMCIQVDFIYSDTRKKKVWDCPGFKDLFLLTSTSIKNIDLLILVFDVGTTKTFINLEDWMKLAAEEFDDLNKFKIPIICVGNKIDMHQDKKVIMHVSENDNNLKNSL